MNITHEINKKVRILEDECRNFSFSKGSLEPDFTMSGNWIDISNLSFLLTKIAELQLQNENLSRTLKSLINNNNLQVLDINEVEVNYGTD